MRPIKFRGHSIGADKMVYGEYAQAFMGGNPQICYFDEHGWTCTEVDPDSIAQLVGFDRNGEEVYEGDNICNPNDGTRFKAAMNHINTVKIYEKVT